MEMKCFSAATEELLPLTHLESQKHDAKHDSHIYSCHVKSFLAGLAERE